MLVSFVLFQYQNITSCDRLMCSPCPLLSGKSLKPKSGCGSVLCDREGASSIGKLKTRVISSSLTALKGSCSGVFLTKRSCGNVQILALSKIGPSCPHLSCW